MYHLTFSITEADYIEFNMHFLTSRTSKIFFRVTRIVFLPLTILLTLSHLLFAEEIRIVPLILSVILILGLTVGLKPFFLLFNKLMIKLLKKQGKLPFYNSVQLRFDEDSYTETTERAESKIKYTTLEKIAEGRSAIYLYTGAAEANIIPYRAFENAEHKNYFMAFINSKKS